MRNAITIHGSWSLLAFTLSAAMVCAQDMPLSQVLIDGQGWEQVADGLAFTEGPATDAHGNLFFTDVPVNRIHKLSPDGTLSVFVKDARRTDGTIFGPDGRLYGCQMGTKRVVAFDEKGHAETIAEDVVSNDLVITHDGKIYFTEPEAKKVWLTTPDGKTRVVDEGIESPNGIILWPDQGTLVVADTHGRHLWAFRVEPDGSLTAKQPYYTMRTTMENGWSMADGMTVDSDARLYVATDTGLQVFDPTGRLCGVILKPQNKFLSNVTFGGPGLHWLYVTCADKVYRRQTKATGVLFFQPPLLK